jgi:hypothetical protein
MPISDVAGVELDRGEAASYLAATVQTTARLQLSQELLRPRRALDLTPSPGKPSLRFQTELEGATSAGRLGAHRVAGARAQMVFDPA